MKHILIPLDFHKASFSAYNYAVRLAHLLSAKVTVLHVVNGSFSTDAALPYAPMIDLEKRALSRLKYMTEEYTADIGVTLPKVLHRYEVRFGVPGYSIAEYASVHDVDYIVMGSRDKYGFFDRIIGSASSLTIRNASCPVILVHEMTPFVKPEKIVFGFDTDMDIDDNIEEYKELNEVLRAKTDFIHVDTGKNKDVTEETEEIVNTLLDDDDLPFSFEIKRIPGKDLRSTIADYCLFSKADMLAMIHREEGLFSNIFKTNLSVKMAHELHLPVIVFQEKN